MGSPVHGTVVDGAELCDAAVLVLLLEHAPTSATAIAIAAARETRLLLMPRLPLEVRSGRAAGVRRS
jgi:hypothetical protein